MTDTAPIIKLLPFAGRDLTVTSPSAEQIAVMLSLDEELTDIDSLSVADALHLAARAMAIVQGMVSPDDWHWIQMGMARKRVTWEQTLELVRLIPAAFAEENAPNRAAKRAVKKAVKKTTARAVRR